jgi:hypothetical protein
MWLLLLLLMMLLLLRRSLLLLLGQVLARVGLVREMLVLRVNLLDLVRILRATRNHDLRLHRLLKPGRFGLQYDVYTHELTFATVDWSPFVDNACDPILNRTIVLREFNVLVLDELVDDPATIWGGNVIHVLLGVAMVSTELVKLTLELLKCNVLPLGLGILPGSSMFRFLQDERC